MSASNSGGHPASTFSVGSTTSQPSLSEQVRRYKSKRFKEKQEHLSKKDAGGAGAYESLQMKCIKVLVANFEKSPTHDGRVESKHLLEITSRLPIDLDPKQSAVFVHDESYWKRACLDPNSTLTPSECQIVEHGMTWKQLFFEHHLRRRLELFDDRGGQGGDAEDGKEEEKKTAEETVEDLLEEIEKYQDYIFGLSFKQLPSHLEVDRICEKLPNLTKMDIQYGINKIGMEYDRRLFGMKISDASCVAKAIKDSMNLTSVVLCGNLMDDDLLRMLMTGLYKSSTITHLDVSHNKITNHGVRLLAKLLGSKSVLTSLSVADNQIHAEGGRYLGRALRSNDSLSDLNIRLNRLTDEGGRMLLEGLRDNQSITKLNIGSNSLGTESMTALSVVLREPASELLVLDMSSNHLSDDDIDVLYSTIQRKSKLISLDLRMNSTSQENETLERIADLLHTNELAFREGS